METATPGATINPELLSAGADRIFDAWEKELHQWASIDTGTRKISGSA